MLIQPVMGMGLSASVRLQLNLDMMQVDNLPPFDSLPIPRLLVPVIWFENTIQEPPETLLILLKDALALPITMARGMGALFLCEAVVFATEKFKVIHFSFDHRSVLNLPPLHMGKQNLPQSTFIMNSICEI